MKIGRKSVRCANFFLNNSTDKEKEKEEFFNSQILDKTKQLEYFNSIITTKKTLWQKLQILSMLQCFSLERTRQSIALSQKKA